MPHAVPQFDSWYALEAALANGELLKEAARHHRWEAYQRQHPINHDVVHGYSLVAACFMIMGLWPVLQGLPLDALVQFCAWGIYAMLVYIVKALWLMYLAMNSQKKNFLAAEAAAAHEEAREVGPAEKHIEESVCA